MLTIRPVTYSDLDAITHIYNQAIETTTATFDMEPKTIADRKEWMDSHDDRHPILVAEWNGSVVGWACLTKWSDRPAYVVTAESSFYVEESYRGKGIGRKLKESIIDRARQLGFHSLIARMAEGSDASYHLNESFGFRYVGVLKEVGRKFGKLLDVHIFQKMLDETGE